MTAGAPRLPDGLVYGQAALNLFSDATHHSGGYGNSAQNADLSRLLNSQQQNAYTPPPETIESWCDRLQKAVERCGDNTMPYEEYARWSDELEAWKAKV